MAISTEGSPKSVRGRMTYGSTGRRRRSSKARSSISGGSWDQSSLPLSLRGTSFKTTTRTPNAANIRHHRRVRLNRPTLPPGSSQVILARNQSSEQVQPFDAFVNVPSPFAKQKEIAKHHSYYPATTTTTNTTTTTRHPNIDTTFTDTFKTFPRSHHTSTPHPPHPPLLHCSSAASPEHTFVHAIKLVPDPIMYSNKGIEGYLDPTTRAANLQHTKPEWTTWDFLDVYLYRLPPGIKTVDLWRNFKKEGEVDMIDIFVTRGGQKDTQARLRFRQVLFKSIFYYN